MTESPAVLLKLFLNLMLAFSIGASSIPRCEAQDRRRPVEAGPHFEPKNFANPRVAIPNPDLSKMDTEIQQQLRDAQSTLSSAMQTPGITASQLGEAYGQLGRLYEAYGLRDAALACFLNAQNSDPDRFDWEYYLGYSYQRRGNLKEARVFLGKALEMRPHDSAVLLRLAQVNLDLKHPELARRLVQEVGATTPLAAALATLGEIAMSERNFSVAVEKFEAALALEPQASSLRYPLGLAYRGLGDLAKAEANLEKKGTGEPKVPDPLIDELQDLRMGFGNLWSRGTQALAAGRVTEAVAAYRKMVEISPNNPSSRMYLAIALARAGNPDAAVEQFAEALRISPNHAGVRYNFGLLLAQRGLEQQAVEHFRAAILSNPELKDGHFQLANLLMRAERYDEARLEYGAVVRMDPQNGFARFMQAMALVRLKQYVSARAQLEQDLTHLADDADIAGALARLLAACPENMVRDGPRALKLAERAFQTQKDVDTGETLAMALAEVQLYDQAAQLQRTLIAQVDELREPYLVQSLRDNLILYEHRKACRRPWRDDDPIFRPVLGK